MRAASSIESRRRRGLTLVELAVVIVVATILVAMAVPNFSGMIARARVKGVTDELTTSLQFARSEAVQRNGDIVMDFSSNANMTCYAISTYKTIGRCECLNESVDPCFNDGLHGGRLLRIVRVPSQTGVSITTDQVNGRLKFKGEAGGGGLETDVQTITVQSGPHGTLQTRLTETQFSVCTPDHTIGGVPPC